MSQHETLKTSWVYSLKKEELVTYLVQCGQEPSGTVDELRKRLAKIITADPEENLVEKLLEWQRQHDPGLSCSPSITGRVSSGKSELMKPESAKLVVPTMPPSVTLEAGRGDSSTLAAREDRIATIELMRKWGVKYDGGKDVLKFVVRLEELATMYEVDLNTVVPMMCELLKDRALIWFRNNRKPWEQWSWFKKDLLDFFLPQRYFEKLEPEIRSRTQRPRENFEDYLLALQDLMYHANMSEDAKLEIIFRNSLPEYQWYIRRKDFSTLEELLSLAAELEGIPNPKPSGRSEHHRMLVDELSSPMSITALSRHPVTEIHLASIQTSRSCPWYTKKLEEVRKQPELHSDYTIADNKLYRHFTREINEDDCTPWKLCIPTEQRQQVLMETHDNITGGHMGVRKTLNKVASRYYWPGMARDIARYVQQCHTCQRYKVSQQLPAGKMLTRVPEEPWSQLCADFIGPLPRTAHGNTMVLVLFDNFSKWVELIPMRKATAEGVVKALRERIVSRYGVPKILITDNGTQFTSHSLKKYLENIGVRQQFTAPYTPQENPTERANRTIKTIIAKFSGQQHNRWDEILPEVMLAMNSSESESTGYSAAFLTQGRSPRLPKALYDEDTIGTGARVIDPTHRADELKEIFKIVRRNLQTASQKQRHHYNLRRRHWTPKIGDLVLVRQHPLSKAVENFAAKLAPKFGGPYVITGFISPVIVQLKAVDSNEKRNAHLSELKVYHPNNLNISPIFHRSTNIKLRRDGDSMETPQEKFERTRAKFRRNLEEENRKARRTVFLDDEIPSTSKGTAREHQPQPRPRTRYPRSEPTPSNYQTTKADKAQLFRMNVVPPQDENPNQAGDGRMKTPEPRAAGDDIIYISDSEDATPPPPPLNIRSEEGAGDQTPTSLIWDDRFLSLDDLDLNDPFILEFWRTFGGIDDTTVEVRPQSPPSPMSSTSSMDWESESFRPPTPPKRKGYVTFEVRDRQYPYWGMQCYEREWKARIIIPKRNTTAAIVGRPEPSATPSKRETPKTIYESPTHNCKPLHITTPPTPGRGWLNRLDELGNERNTVQHEASTTPTTSRATSPIPPPPPVIPFIHTQTPKPTPVPESLQFEDLPIDIQREINRRVNTFPTKRARFIHSIYGHPYRVNTRGDGIVHIRRT